MLIYCLNYVNLFLANFSNNLFDQREFEDTLEYFRETIRSFDFSRIVNQIVSNRAYLSASIGQLLHRVADDSDIDDLDMTTSKTRRSDDSDAGSSSSCLSDNPPDTPSAPLTSPQSLITTTTTTAGGDNSSATASNSSSTSSLTSLVVQGRAEGLSKPTTSSILPSTTTTTTTVAKRKQIRQLRKSHLRIIYEWLKGLYCIQARGNVNICSKSTGSMQTLIPSNPSFGNHLQRVNYLK